MGIGTMINDATRAFAQRKGKGQVARHLAPGLNLEHMSPFHDQMGPINGDPKHLVRHAYTQLSFQSWWELHYS